MSLSVLPSNLITCLALSCSHDTISCFHDSVTKLFLVESRSQHSHTVHLPFQTWTPPRLTPSSGNTHFFLLIWQFAEVSFHERTCEVNLSPQFQTRGPPSDFCTGVMAVGEKYRDHGTSSDEMCSGTTSTSSSSVYTDSVEEVPHPWQMRRSSWASSDRITSDPAATFAASFESKRNSTSSHRSEHRRWPFSKRWDPDLFPPRLERSDKNKQIFTKEFDNPQYAFHPLRENPRFGQDLTNKCVFNKCWFRSPADEVGNQYSHPLVDHLHVRRLSPPDSISTQEIIPTPRKMKEWGFRF